MTDLIAIALNPAVDSFTAVEKIEAAKKLRCENLQYYPGGGGVNVCRMASRLGASVRLIYTQGGAEGSLLRQLITREKIESISVTIDQETRQDFTIYERSTGQEYRFVLPGPFVAEREWKECLELLGSPAFRPKFIAASGSLPPGVPDDFYARMGIFARQIGAKYVVDTSGRALITALREPIYLLKPNLRELGELWGEPLEDEEEVRQACHELIKEFPLENIVVSLGEKGAMLVCKQGSWRAHPPPVRVMTTVGAGDFLLGAMIAALALGESILAAFEQGVAAGTAAVQTATGICEEADVRLLREQISIERLSEDSRNKQQLAH